jgi:hypothetical protein
VFIPAGSPDQQSPASNSQSFWPGLETANFAFVFQNIFTSWNVEFATGEWSLFPTWCYQYVLRPLSLLPVDSLIPAKYFAPIKAIVMIDHLGTYNQFGGVSIEIHTYSLRILELCLNTEGVYPGDTITNTFTLDSSTGIWNDGWDVLPPECLLLPTLCLT